MEPKFIHLNLHSEYTVTAGMIDLDSLFKQCRLLNYPAVAITDPNLFASVKFYQKSLANGIKPILGSELKVLFNGGGITACIIALVKNKIGYLNLLKLNSLLHTSEQKLINDQELAEYNEGLIILSGNLEVNFIKGNADYFKHYFLNNFYLEVARLGVIGEEVTISKIVDCAKNYHFPLVATNRVYFLEEHDYEAHEIKVCINNGYLLNEEDRPRYQASQYLKSSEEMEKLFADLPESLINTVEIAKRCNLQIEIDKICLPEFPLPAGENIDNY